ncbi:MAG: amidohydrolase family protein [Aggregatilineales bacterium]
MIVDTHVHVWRAILDYPIPTTTPISPLSDVPVELLREYMDEYGINRSVLVQPLYPGEDNSYVADCAAADPARFAAVCVVNPRDPGADDRLEFWGRERDCKGLRLRPRIPSEGAVFGSRATLPLWQRASALSIVISLLANPEHLPTVASLAERFSDLPILLDHMAHPDVAGGVQTQAFQTLLNLARYPHIYVKVSGYYYYSRQSYPYADCHDLFRALYDRFGPMRLIWGSDFPHVLLKVGYRRNFLLQQRAYLFLSQVDLDLIMGENAARLYWPQ